MLEINTTCVTPEIVLKNSGHIQKFADLMVKDEKTNTGYRADKLLSEFLQKKADKKNTSEEEKKQIAKILL